MCTHTHTPRCNLISSSSCESTVYTCYLDPISTHFIRLKKGRNNCAAMQCFNPFSTIVQPLLIHRYSMDTQCNGHTVSHTNKDFPYTKSPAEQLPNSFSSQFLQAIPITASCLLGYACKSVGTTTVRPFVGKCIYNTLMQRVHKRTLLTFHSDQHSQTPLCLCITSYFSVKGALAPSGTLPQHFERCNNSTAQGASSAAKL